MPGWNYGSGSSIDPGTFIPAGDADTSPKPDVFLDNKIQCDQCISCNSGDSLTKKRKRRTCCGCVNMDLTYLYKDIGACPGCNPDDEMYPGNGSNLAARKDGTATMSSKYVKICDIPKQALIAPYKYPAFPAKASFQWDGIENGKWDSIPRYWGNRSQSCDNWSTTDLQPADLRDVGGRLARAKYNSKFLEEGKIVILHTQN